jgi:hypothetical protein
MNNSKKRGELSKLAGIGLFPRRVCPPGFSGPSEVELPEWAEYVCAISLFYSLSTLQTYSPFFFFVANVNDTQKAPFPLTYDEPSRHMQMRA